MFFCYSAKININVFYRRQKGWGFLKAVNFVIGDGKTNQVTYRKLVGDGVGSNVRGEEHQALGAEDLACVCGLHNCHKLFVFLSYRCISKRKVR